MLVPAVTPTASTFHQLSSCQGQTAVHFGTAPQLGRREAGAGGVAAFHSLNSMASVMPHQ